MTPKEIVPNVNHAVLTILTVEHTNGHSNTAAGGGTEFVKISRMQLPIFLRVEKEVLSY